MANTELDFDLLTLIEVPVKYLGKKYYLREASGDAAVKYRNARLRCHIYNSEGNLSELRDLANVEPLLVSLTLFDEKDKPVPESVIRSWPARIQKQLYEKAKEISEIGEGDSPQKVALDKVLDTPGSPISRVAFVEWLEKVVDDSLEPLRAWFRETPEEAAKNGQSGSTAGTESLKNSE